MSNALWHRLQLLFGVGETLRATHERIQARVLESEYPPHVDRIEPYGLSYRPKPGSEVYLLFPAGDRSYGVALVVGDRRYQMALAARVIARNADQKNETLIDYEHQSLLSGRNGQPAPAAGWFGRLEWRDGKGLYATAVRWTDRARALIAAREYRYLSAVFAHHPTTGAVLKIISAALTNTPALDGLEPLAALSKHPALFLDLEEQGMSKEDEERIAALSVECGTLKAQLEALKAVEKASKEALAALTAERDAANKKLADIEAAARTAALAKEKEERDALLKDIPPALKADLETMPLAALKNLLSKVAPLALLNRQSEDKPGAAVALTKEELAFCEKLNVSPENFKKAKE